MQILGPLMLIFRLIAISLMLTLSSAAQQNNVWYFGKKAGLNFNAARPQPLHNSAMDADEGSASICDNSGNLLFYTNGLTVYNKNHQVMLNGTGLLSNLSTVQSALIVPLPGSNSLYYIFTTDAIENNFLNGYNYSVVDMTRDNGRGEVITKNVLFEASCTERLTAARHADGTSIWIITNDRNSNRFRSWLMDCNGLSSNPVVSTAGEILNSHSLINTGMMKVSPDGKLLCQTHFPFLDDGVVLKNFFQLFSFDNSTGIVSDARRIDPGDASITSCEFSPDSKLIYISRAYDKKIDQYDVSLPTVPQIVASRFTINTPEEAYYGIQLAPDQKIYLASPSNYLGSINRPNVRGSGCTFSRHSIDVNEMISGNSFAGLPNFINDLSFNSNNGFTYAITDSCTGTVQFNGNSTIPGTLSYSWDFGDGFSSTLQNPVHTFSNSGLSYLVRLRISSAGGCASVIRTGTVIPKGLSLSAEFDHRVVCDSGYVRFFNTSVLFPDSSGVNYYWDFGDGNTSTSVNPVHNFTPGTYRVTLNVRTSTPCLDKSFSQQVIMQQLNIQAPPDMEINPGESVQLSVSGGGTRFSWSPRTGLSNATLPNPVAKPAQSTLYIVTVFNSSGCKDEDSVFIKVKPVPGIYVPTGFTPNNDGKNDLLRPYLAENFLLRSFSVFNRWGQKIYTTSVPGAGWNGKIGGILQNPGVYVWLIEAQDIQTGTTVKQKGSFIIIR